MSKTIIVNKGGNYDDNSYTDERHYHYADSSTEEKKKNQTADDENNGEKVSLRVRLRLAEELLSRAGASTSNTDRSKLMRLMALLTGTSEGYVKKIFTDVHVDVSQNCCQKDLNLLRKLLKDAELELYI